MEILLVEDNRGDVVLTKEALREGGFHNHLSVASDGEDAIRFLEKRGEYASAPTPDLVLLDLNLPKRSGLDVLKTIKESPELRAIPVVVLTTSTAEADLAATYNLHANCFVAKPLDFDRFIDLIRQIEIFWFERAVLPGHVPGK